MNHAYRTSSSNAAAPDAALIEQLLRYLDGTLPREEHAAVAKRLADDAAARRLLRDLSEQIVCLGEFERRRELPAAASLGSLCQPARPSSRHWVSRWQSIAMALIASIIVTASGYSAWTLGRLPPARVVKTVGATRLFSASGTTLDAIPNDQRLRPGDTLESRATDAWITTDVIGGRLTIAGNSVLRVLRPLGNEQRLELVAGNLWLEPSPDSHLGDVIVQMPTATVKATGCLLDVRTSATDSLIRVHRGRAEITRRLTEGAIELLAGEQIKLSLDTSATPLVTPQPLPTHQWTLDLHSAAMVSHGVVLPASNTKPTRLAAIPLLWKEGVTSPLLLYAAGVAAWMMNESPLEIRADSVIIFRGLMEAPSNIRLGMTTQRMQGVFAGKFEVTVPAENMSWDGEQWLVSLQVSDFHAMNPQLATSPIGLEVGDLYAVTLDPDAKLQLTGIEMAAGQATSNP
jgi:ferric-dicitrate binding protein FerR (iron transport regulator)